MNETGGQQNAPPVARVPALIKLGYALGATGDALALNLVSGWALFFYVNTLKVDPVVVGWGLMLPRMWDAISDPLMGHISDNTRSRWGRRRPYILFGSALFALSLFAIFAPPDFSAAEAAVGGHFWASGSFWYLLLTAALFYTGYTIVMVPYSALGAEMSVDYHERTRIVAWRTFLSTGLGFATASSWWLAQKSFWPSERFGWAAVAALAGLLTIGAMVVVFYATREQEDAPQQQTAPLLKALGATLSNFPYIVLIASFFVLICGIFTIVPFMGFLNISYVYAGDSDAASKLTMFTGQLSSISSALSVFLFTWLGIRIGKRNAFVAAALILSVCFAASLVLITPHWPYLQLVFSAVSGLAVAGILLFPLPMIADVCDMDELRTGLRREGSYIGLFSFTFKAGLSLVTLLSSYCLKWAGFDESLAVQTPDTVWNMRMMLAFIPLVAVAIGALLALLYPLSERRVREIRVALDARHAAASP